MGNVFRPGDPKFGRALQAVTMYSCAAVMVNGIFVDHGRQENVLTPFQTYACNRLDKYFNISEEELSILPKKEEKESNGSALSTTKETQRTKEG